MTNEAILRRLAEKELNAKIDGIKSIILDLRGLLHKLEIIKIPQSSFDSYSYMRKHSKIFKKRV